MENVLEKVGETESLEGFVSTLKPANNTNEIRERVGWARWNPAEN